jgi:hypothetical protein
METVPHLSRRRAFLIGAAGFLLAAAAYAPYAIVLILIALASIPPDCGFDAGMDCKNPDANNTSAIVMAVIASGLFLGLMTLGLRGLIRRAIRSTGARLYGASGLAMALALAVLPAVVAALVAVAMGRAAGGQAKVFADASTGVSLIVLGGLAGVAAWSILLRRVITPAAWESP